MKTRMLVLASLLLAALPLAPAPASAVQQTLTVDGVAAVVDGRVGQALERAKADALRTAIEQVMGLSLESRVIIRNELLSESRLTAYTRGGIKRYRVLSQKAEPGRVAVRLLVTVTDLPKDMALCPACGALGWPRFLVVRSGEGEHRAVARAAEAALVQALGAKYFVAAPGRAGLPDGPRPDVIIRLSDWSSEGGFDSVANEERVSFMARAEMADSGQVLAAHRVSALAGHPSRDRAADLAAAKAGGQAAQALIPAMAAWWNRFLANGLPIRVILKHPSGAHQAADRFEAALTRLPGVSVVRGYRRGPGQAGMIVRYKGPADWLRREISHSLPRSGALARLRNESARSRVLVYTLL